MVNALLKCKTSPCVNRPNVRLECPIAGILLATVSETRQAEKFLFPFPWCITYNNCVYRLEKL